MHKASLIRASRKVCFLSGPPSAKRIMRDVRSTLIDLDVIVRTADEIATGNNLAESLIDAVTSADFVCIAMSATRPSLAVMYEAGIAAGSERPLIVVVDAKAADDLPTQLISGSVIRYKPGMSEVLRDTLQAYVKQVQPAAVQHILSKTTLTDFSVTDRQHRPSLDSVLEERVAARLEAAGALVARERRLAGNLRPDIITTFPQLSPEFNPIIVEVKGAFTWRSPSADTIAQVRNYLRAARARLGLIVYESRDQMPRTDIHESLGILILSMDDLDEWGNQRLLDEITSLRNKVVHSA